MTPAEYRDLSSLISVLGTKAAQDAAQNHTIRSFIEAVQGR